MAVPRRPRFVLQVLRSAGRSVVTLPIVLYTALQHSLQVRDKRAGELEGLFFHGQSVHLTPKHYAPTHAPRTNIRNQGVRAAAGQDCQEALHGDS